MKERYTAAEWQRISTSTLPCVDCGHPLYKHDSGAAPDFYCGGMPPEYKCVCRVFGWAKLPPEGVALHGMLL